MSGLKLKIEAQAQVRANLARRHLDTALYFAAQCRNIEQAEGLLPWPQPSWDKNQSYAVGTVLLAVAALEAAVNELFRDSIDRTQALGSVTPDQMRLLATLWPEVETYPILRKYQVVLTACGHAPLPEGEAPFQPCADLITLRNELVHFKPEWDHELRKHKKLESRLSTKFAQNQLSTQSAGTMVWFPHRCLGAGSAEWAWATVRAFSVAFGQQLGVGSRL